MDKQALRRSGLQTRSTMNSTLYQRLNTQILQHLKDFLRAEWTQGATVLAYWPLNQEPDLTGLFGMADYQWGLPRCLPDRRLAWHYWQPEQPLVAGQYGLWEPDPSWPEVSPAAVALLLIPAIRMDRRGYRLGYGGGYFDRLLAEPAWAEVFTLGVTFDALVCEALPIADWDLPLGGILTESGVLKVRSEL
jgi:5-formyltetrahydrofolate cyclo-ligase